MLTTEQLALRKTGLGSTDIVRLSGESPWGTAHDVYTDKTTDETKPQNEAMSLGHRLEPIVCELIAEKFGLTLADGLTERHPIVAWALSTPDRLAMNGKSRIGVAEAKVVGARLFGHWAEDEPPSYVHIQAQWHCTITRTPVCYVGALLGTEFRGYVVEHDPDLGTALLELGDRFWRNHVTARIPPTVDGSESARRMLRAAWPRPGKAVAIATEAIDRIALTCLEARAREAEWKDRRELAEQQLCEFIGENEGVDGRGWRATWKLRAEHTRPACIVKASRVFLMKETKVKAA